MVSQAAIETYKPFNGFLKAQPICSRLNSYHDATGLHIFITVRLPSQIFASRLLSSHLMSRRNLCYFKSLVLRQREVYFPRTCRRSFATAVDVLRRKSLALSDQSFGWLSLSVSPIWNLGKTVFHGSAMSSMSRPSDHRSREPDTIDISDGLHS